MYSYVYIPKIFIIATGPDIRTVREIAKRQFVQDGLQIVELSRLGEHAKSSDERQEVAIGECDAVFHLVGRTFGPKPAQFDLKQRRRGYGEIEHEIAVRLGKPTFTVVCDVHYFYDQHEHDSPSLEKLHHDRRERILKSDVPHLVVKSRKELLAQVTDFAQAVKTRQFGPGWQTDAAGEAGGWDWQARPPVAAGIRVEEAAPEVDSEVPAEAVVAPAHPAAPIGFALYGPESLVRGDEGALDLWAFVEAQRPLMEQAAARHAVLDASGADPDTAIEFDLLLTIPALEIYEQAVPLTWNGLPVCASWTIQSPPLVQGDGNFGKIEVRALGVRVATLQFQVSVSSARQRTDADSATRQEWPAEIGRPQTAFVCYASAERAYVDPVLRPLAALWPELDLFLDAGTLREQEDWWEQCLRRIPGSELFLLVWSSVADQSDQVHEELALALEGQGQPGIVPFPIENSELAPPPLSLPAEQFEAAFRLVVAAQEWPAEEQAPVEEEPSGQ